MRETLLEFDGNNSPTKSAYNKLTKGKQDTVDKFERYCLITASAARAKKIASNTVRFLVMADKPTSEIDLEDLRDFLRILKKSSFSDYYKNDVKGFVQRFLKWHFRDWSDRFNDFEDIKYNSDAQRMKRIAAEDILSKQDVERLIKAEPSLFWKTFLIVQYEACLRTLEARSLKWDMFDMEDEEVYWITITSKKNKNGTAKERVSPPLSQSIGFLKELRSMQDASGRRDPYVFPSKQADVDYISSGSVSKWFSRLTKRVLGHSVKSYLLRHSNGEELHKRIREGTLSKENAVQMMGHSEKMFDKTYSHANRAEMKKVLKKQMLDIDFIAPEKKHKLERDVEKLLQTGAKREKLDAILLRLLQNPATKKAITVAMMEEGIDELYTELSAA